MQQLLALLDAQQKACDKQVLAAGTIVHLLTLIVSLHCGVCLLAAGGYYGCFADNYYDFAMTWGLDQGGDFNMTWER